jgi:hypothetical protein
VNTRELNRITNERHLYLAQLNAILPTISYLLNRLAVAKVKCEERDVKLITSVNDVLRARTFEEVETIVGRHNDEMIGELMDKFFGGNEAVDKLLQDLIEAKGDRREEEEQDTGDGYGEPGFDDFRDPNTGEDLWPKN